MEQNEKPRGLAEAGRVCTSLHRACYDLRFYPPEHPMARQSLDTLHDSLRSFHESFEALHLEVAERAFLYEGEDAYVYEGDRENIAFILFRDGIRLLTLRPGIERAELEVLLDVLAHPDDPAVVPVDIVSTLWEKDFDHIDYEAVDLFRGGGEPLRGRIDALRQTVLRRLDKLELTRAERPSEDWAFPVPINTVGPESLVLGPEDLRDFDEAAARVGRVQEDFQSVLFELLQSWTTSELTEETAARATAALVDGYLAARDLSAATALLAAVESAGNAGLCPPNISGQALGDVLTPRRLQSLTHQAAALTPEEAADLDSFLSFAGPLSYPAFLETLFESNDRVQRRLLLGMLERNGTLQASQLVPWFSDPRWFVVRNVVQLAATTRDPAVTPYLNSALRHSDARVRSEVVRALEQVGDQDSLTGLTRAVGDSDATVRILAARVLARRGGRVQEEAVLAQIEMPDFDNRSREEVQALLLALAFLAKGRAIPVLENLWKRKAFRSHPLPVRLIALEVLGYMSDPAAKKSLDLASTSGDEPIRRAAGKALRAFSRLSADEQTLSAAQT
jgi:HEAT repeat protein